MPHALCSDCSELCVLAHAGAPSSFLSERFKPQRAPAFRRAFFHGSSAPLLGMDGSKHGDLEFELDPRHEPTFSLDDDDSSKHSATSVLAMLDDAADGAASSPRERGSKEEVEDEVGSEQLPALDTPAVRRLKNRQGSVRASDFSTPKEEPPSPNSSPGSPLPGSASPIAQPRRGYLPRRSHDDFEGSIVRPQDVPDVQTARDDEGRDGDGGDDGDGGSMTRRRRISRPATASDLDIISSGLDPELRHAVQTSFRARTPSAAVGGRGVLATINASPGGTRGGREVVALSETSLAPEEMGLWKDAGLARIVEWESFDAASMAEIGHGEFATAWATTLDGYDMAVKVISHAPHSYPTSRAQSTPRCRVPRIKRSAQLQLSTARTAALGVLADRASALCMCAAGTQAAQAARARGDQGHEARDHAHVDDDSP